MKVILPVAALLFLFSSHLIGQEYEPAKEFHSFKSDSILRKSPSEYFRKYGEDGQYKRFTPYSQNPEKYFRFETPGIRYNYERAFNEKFPGSEKFYSRRPGLIINAPEAFITRPPDSGNKYYLIIYDPVVNRRIN